MPVPLGTQTYYYGGKQLANPVAGQSGPGAPPTKVPAEAVIGQTTYTNTTTQAVYMLTSKSPVTWSILGEGPSGGFPITPYVVGPSGSAGYQTVQSAVNAAHAAGGGTVYVQNGTYTESLTLYDAIQIVGVSGFRDDVAGATIVGVHTPPASGNFTFSNLTLQSATHIFSSAVAGTAHLVIANCNTVVTSGYTYNLASWTGILEFYDTDSAGTTTDGAVNNTAGATVYVYGAGIGGGTGNAMIVTGTMLSSQSNFYCPITFQTGTSFTIDQATFANTVTCSNNSTGTIAGSRFSTGSTAALTMSSSAAVSLLNSVITSTNISTISGSGAGTLTLSGMIFTGNIPTIATTLTVAWARDVGVLSPYVAGLNGTFSTIQAAINIIKPVFGPHTLYIQPGLYGESLDFTGFAFACNVHIRGISLNARSSIDGVSLIGNITPPSSGRLLFEDVNLNATTGDCIASSDAGTAQIWLRNCNAETTGGGYIVNIPNWTSSGSVILQGFIEAATGIASNGIITGSANVIIEDCPYLGTATGSGMTISGSTVIKNSIIYCPFSFATGASFNCISSIFNAAVTAANNSTGTFALCEFSTGAAAALTMSSSAAVSVLNTIITSSNNPSIAGAGAGILTLGGVTFTSNSALAGTLTLTYAASKLGATIMTGNSSVTGSFTASTTLTATSGAITATNGNVVLGTAGNKILSTSVATTTTAGANSFGSVTLVSGSATVATTAVTSSSLIVTWRQSLGATGANPVGEITVGTITNGTSFVINSATPASATTPLATDVSVVGWMIIN